MSVTSPASPKQIGFIRRLQAERNLDLISDQDAAALTGGRNGSASALIDRLMDMPKVQAQESQVADLTPGVYETDGTIYIVKPTKAEYEGQPLSERRLYAKRVVEIGGTRTTKAGTFVAVEFEYDRGAVYRIQPEHRITGDRAKQLTIRYGKCIVCGHDLKAGESVEQGIGPVCVKMFPDLVEERKAIKSRARKEAQGQAELTACAPQGAPEPMSLTALAARIEGKDDEAGTDRQQPRSSYLRSLGRQMDAVSRPNPAELEIDREARVARAFIEQAIAAYEFEAGPMDEQREQALQTFDRLVEGYER